MSVSDTATIVSRCHMSVSDTATLVSWCHMSVSDTVTLVSWCHMSVSDTATLVSWCHMSVSDTATLVSWCHMSVSDTATVVSWCHMSVSDTATVVSWCHIIIGKRYSNTSLVMSHVFKRRMSRFWCVPGSSPSGAAVYLSTPHIRDFYHVRGEGSFLSISAELGIHTDCFHAIVDPRRALHVQLRALYFPCFISKLLLHDRTDISVTWVDPHCNNWIKDWRKIRSQIFQIRFLKYL